MGADNLKIVDEAMIPRFRQFPLNKDEEIVISGMGGRFPSSHNIEELRYHLYNKIDMCTDTEVRYHHRPDVPKRLGTCFDLEKFDSTFFGIASIVANCMDPQCRGLMEHAFEAVLDAGLNPQDIRGKHIGVYVGLMYQESSEGSGWRGITKGTGIRDGYSIIGLSRAMCANRISYFLDLHGPSYLVDSACSSSMTALNCAYTAIRNGECEAALVCGSNTTLSPDVSYSFNRLGVTANDGVCRPFDEKASGYTRSELMSVFVLQKRKDARRIYGTLVHSKLNNDGFKEQGITFPAYLAQKQLLETFYKEINLDPSTINYVETHGTSTIVGDPEECKAIHNVFCKNRKTPLLIGSVKSNLGHTEGGSALASLAKVLLAFECGKIAPNINFTRCRKDIPVLIDGHLKVCCEVTDLPGELIASNSFGFGGSNGHILLRRHDKFKVNHGIPSDGLPRLVCWSGRTEETCNLVFDEICKRPLDAEYVGLIHHVQMHPIPNNLYTGYGLFKQQGDGNATCISREVHRIDQVQRPLVWVFSGMGSQWLQMGASLMKLPMFRESIEKSHDVLKQKNLNLIDILTSNHKNMFDNILHSFVGIAAIQIAIVDVLRYLEITPDYMIGHSVGELGCGYADGCFTAEEMLLMSYSRGMVSIESKVYGSMAAVGLGYQQLRTMLPEGVEAACHNGPDSCTISGPTELVESFVKKLTKDGVFAKEVACSNIPYHSSYIAPMGSKLLDRFQKIVKVPKKRSSKWLSTSVPAKNWSSEMAALSSAEYHTNNLLSPVLFEETMEHLPQNACTVEIGPHGLLTAILKRSMPNGYHINVTQRGSEDNLNVFLAGLGKLYTQKVHVSAAKLYPPVEFPVSVGTPSISHLIRWEHTDNFFVANFDESSKNCAEQTELVDLATTQFKHINGHVIDGRILLPATEYINIVWNAFATMKNFYNANFDTPVEFTDVKFLRASTFTKDLTTMKFTTVIHPITGQFEVTESDTPVVIGRIQYLQGLNDLDVPIKRTSDVTFKSRDFYKELKLRGYHYKDEFRTVLEARADGTGGRVKWIDNFVTFLDCMMQLVIIGVDSRSLAIPTGIGSLKIDPKRLVNFGIKEADDGTEYVDVTVSKEMKSIHAIGVEIKGLTTNTISRRKPPGEPVLESYQFIPYHIQEDIDTENAVRIITQICIENTSNLKLKCVEVLEANEVSIIVELKKALEDTPKVTSELLMLVDAHKIDSISGITTDSKENLSKHQEVDILIGSDLCNNPNKLELTMECMKDVGFVVSKESKSLDVSKLKGNINGFIPISFINIEDHILVLLSWNKKKQLENTFVVEVSNKDETFAWIDLAKRSLRRGRTYLVAYNEQLSGLIGLVNCLRREPKYDAIAVFIDDIGAPPFDLQLPFYKQQLEKGCVMNVYRNGMWGSQRHLPITLDYSSKPQSKHCFLDVSRRGDLTSLTWFTGGIDATDDDIVNVMYSSLNFRDVMVATGKISLESMFPRIKNQTILGIEYSGLRKNGTRVMGMLNGGCMATCLKSEPYMTWDVPDYWTLAEAVTVPAVYMTVYSAFFFTVHIKAGHRILIHAGTGGVGLAAIRVALSYGLDVFTTVSTKEKKDFLLSTFPELKATQIGNSRDTSFHKMVMLETNGDGVEYVLNSLADDKLLASLDCLGKDGHFLEIGKFDIFNNSKIGMKIFEKNTSFHSVMVDFQMIYKSREYKNAVHQRIQADIDRGIVQPIPFTVFKAPEVEEAFRYLAAAKHMGKVLLQLRENDFDEVTIPLKVKPRIYFKPDLVYIIPGGLGGFGMELADWMVLRGCRKLVMSSRYGITKDYQEYRISLWRSYGVQVIINTDDITTYEGCSKLLQASMKAGAIGGIFNLAVLLRDSIFENQTPKKFRECFAVKANATQYLDDLSRYLCPELEHFVVFSSVSCGLGNAGQTNYGMANSIMERIIEKRVADGFPGRAIEWGAVGEVGLVADLAENKIDMEIGGTLLQRISSCLEVLDTLLSVPQPVVSSMVVAEKKVLLGASILDTVLNIIGIKDLKLFSLDQKLVDSGMDSLMAVEIKETLEREYEIALASQDLRNLTFQKILDLTKLAPAEETSKTTEDDRSSTLALLFDNLGNEEDAYKRLLQLNTVQSSAKHPILLVPGIEGTASKGWFELGEKLSVPTKILQIVDTKHAKSIKEITDTVLQDVESCINESSKSFILVGYSFGTLLTLDLAKRLELLGYEGKVALLDGSPLCCQRIIQDVLLDSNNNAPKSQQVSLGNFLLKSIAPNAPQEIMTKWNSWDDVISSIYEVSRGTMPYSKEYFTTITEAVLNRLKIILEIDPEKFNKINSDIVLVRCADPIVHGLEEDYDLHKCTYGTVTVKFVEGNHLTMLKQDELAKIINDLSFP